MAGSGQGECQGTRRRFKVQPGEVVEIGVEVDRPCMDVRVPRRARVVSKREGRGGLVGGYRLPRSTRFFARLKLAVEGSGDFPSCSGSATAQPFTSSLPEIRSGTRTGVSG